MDSKLGNYYNSIKPTIIYAFVFGFTLFMQCILFHYQAFNSLLVSSIFINPIAFWAFYLPKISICCFVSLFALLFRKKGWTIVASIIVGIWILSELIYYRVNGIFLDAYSFTMVGNMDGFWNGVFAFIRPLDVLIVLPTVLLIVFYYWLKPSSYSLIFSIFFLLLAVGFHIIGTNLLDKQYAIWNHVDDESQHSVYYNPFSEKGAQHFWGFSTTDYAKQTSVIHCFIVDGWNLIKIPFSDNRQVSFSSQEGNAVEDLINSKTSSEIGPNGNLYIILFESLESWAIAPMTTPSIYDFIHSNDNILLANKVIRQTKGGTSADGQMIINTGVLPLLSGAACFRFPGNCYPALSELYENTALIQPGDMSVWNQKRMSDAYQINDNFVVPDSDDSVTFTKLNEIYQDYQYVMAISMASHTPFKNCPGDMKMNWDASMPEKMRDYLDCVHYTDSCLKHFLERVDSDETLKNSTIVITGDHTIFDDGLLHKFNEYSIAHGLEFDVSGSYCPLIIYSKSIQSKTMIEDSIYQMDIFPTILHSIGCDSTYYWKGFGINLLDNNAERLFSAESASLISDKMIQVDYWRDKK